MSRKTPFQAARADGRGQCITVSEQHMRRLQRTPKRSPILDEKTKLTWSAKRSLRRILKVVPPSTIAP
jgi:hypothetical protein